MLRAPLAESQQDRVAASLPFVQSLARRMASTMPHSIDLSDLVQDGVLGTHRRRAPVRRGPRHQVRDVRRTARARRDDRRAAARRLAARRPPRPPRARGGARSASPRARRRADAGRSRTPCGRRRDPPRAHDRAHQHDRIDLAAGQPRDHRQRHAAGGARAERASVARSAVRAGTDSRPRAQSARAAAGA